MQVACLIVGLASSSLAVALRASSRQEQSLRVYVYPVSVRDFDIDPEAAEKYERWLDMSVVPVPHNIDGVESDIEHNHVLHNPKVGLAATAENFGLRVSKPEDANVFWLPISNVMLCLATWKRHEQRFPIISKEAYTCKAYVSILQWLFKQQSWQRNGGADHVFDIDQVPLGFGGLDDNSTHEMLDKALAHSIIITKEDRSPDGFQRIQARKEIIVPYFVDRNKYLVPKVQQYKTTLVSFVGSGDVDCHVVDCNMWNSFALRRRIMRQLKNAKDAVLVDLGGDRVPSNFDWSSARDVYSKSIFCVAPAGDSFSSARLFAVLMSSCIPVNINDYVQLPFEESLPMRWTDFSVNLKEADVLQHGFLNELRKLAADKALLSKMQEAGRKARYLLSYTSHHPSDRLYPDTAQTMILEQIGHVVGAQWHPQHPFRHFIKLDAARKARHERLLLKRERRIGV